METYTIINGQVAGDESPVGVVENYINDMQKALELMGAAEYYVLKEDILNILKNSMTFKVSLIMDSERGPLVELYHEFDGIELLSLEEFKLFIAE